MLKAIALVLTVVFSSSHQQCFSNNDAVPSIDHDQNVTWVESRHNFSLSLFKVLDSESHQKNILFSPSSIQDVLLLAYFGAAHATEASLAKVLQLPVKQRKPVTMRFYNNQKAQDLRSNKPSKPLKTASRIYFLHKISLRPCMVKNFHKGLEVIDDRKGVWHAIRFINNWVNLNTNGKIMGLVKDLSPSSMATIVNAAYFHANWSNAFNKNYLHIAKFYVNPHDILPVQMMGNIGHFDHGYSEELGARMLLLPHEGKKTGMIILLPDKDLDKMIGTMNHGTLNFITDKHSYKSSYFKIIVPLYQHRSNINLNTALRKLGIGNTLTRRADFSGFTGKSEVFFDKVVHESMIMVTEEGAMSSTYTSISRSNIQQSEPFICNRPFAYIVYDFVASNVLFMGTFRDPTPLQQWAA